MKIDSSKICDAFVDIIEKKSKDMSGLEKALKDVTGNTVAVKLVSPVRGNFFIMSITPDKDTVTKIANNLKFNKDNFSLIRELWSKVKNWTLEIDTSLFKLLTADELTALTLHEIGHTISSNSIPSRLNNVLQVSLAKAASVGNRAMLNNKLFNKVVEIPIKVACQFSFDKDGIKRELKADKVAISSGYLPQLLSAMDKVEHRLRDFNLMNTAEGNIDSSVEYVNKILSDLSERKSVIVKKNLSDLKRFLPEGSSIYESVEDIEESFFESGDSSVARTKYVEDRAYKISHEEYVTEFGLGKKLSPITKDQVDYIRIKIEDMHTITDKLMMVSYINSKIELLEYYISILKNPKMAKKYKVPHDIIYLDTTKDLLYKLKEIAIKKPIADQTPKIVVTYPEC